MSPYLSLCLPVSVCLSVCLCPSVCPVSLSLCACETQHGCAKDGPVQTRRRMHQRRRWCHCRASRPIQTHQTHCTSAPRLHALMLLETMSDVGRMDHSETDDEPHHEDTASVVCHAQNADHVYSAVAFVCATSRWSTKSVRGRAIYMTALRPRDLHSPASFPSVSASAPSPSENRFAASGNGRAPARDCGGSAAAPARSVRSGPKTAPAAFCFCLYALVVARAQLRRRRRSAAASTTHPCQRVGSGSAQGRAVHRSPRCEIVPPRQSSGVSSMKRDWMTEIVDHGSDVDMAPRGDQKTQGDLKGWWKSVLCELIVLCLSHVVAVIWIATVLCMGARFVTYRLTVLCVGHVVAASWVASVMCMERRWKRPAQASS